MNYYYLATLTSEFRPQNDVVPSGEYSNPAKTRHHPYRVDEKRIVATAKCRANVLEQTRFRIPANVHIKVLLVAGNLKTETGY
jgi:hypothetical protein